MKEKREHALRPLFDWRSAVASHLGPAKPTTRHVLLTLSLHMSPKGDSCFPSIDLLAEESGLSRRAVIEHLQAAEAAGWIAKQERPQRNGQGWRRMEYYATTPGGIEQALTERPEKAGDRGAPPLIAEAGKGGDRHAEGGDPNSTKVVTDDHPSTSRSTPREKPMPKGPKAPSAVASLWAIYSQGVKAKHNGEPAPSARANGMLSQVVARIGAEPAKAVVSYYLNHRDPWYGRQLHDLRWLVRDCEKLWLELQQRGAGSATPPQKSVVHLVFDEGVPDRWLEDYPVGDPLEIAKRARNAYARMIAARKAKGIKVRIGDRVSTYTIEELRT